MYCGHKLAGIAGILFVWAVVPWIAAAQQSPNAGNLAHQPSALPVGTTGPIQQIPLDSMEPVAPQVQYRNGILTITAANSTLADILRALHQQTSAEVEIPDTTERVVTNLGPGPAPEIISRLLNGSHYNYVLLFSPENPNAVTKILLLAKTTISDSSSPEVAQGAPPSQVLPPQGPGDPNASEGQDDSSQAEKSPPQLIQPAAVGVVALQSPPIQPRGGSIRQASTEFDVPDPVPEPGTLLLVGSGFIGVALSTKLRRSSRK